MSTFPKMMSHGKPTVSSGQVTFTYLDSHSRPVTETKSVLEAAVIARMIKARSKRFHDAAPGARESDKSRRERKWMAAHPAGLLRKAWGLLDEPGKMEFDMAFNQNSHHGVSDQAWAAKHAERTTRVEGDDGKGLC